MSRVGSADPPDSLSNRVHQRPVGYAFDLQVDVHYVRGLTRAEPRHDLRLDRSKAELEHPGPAWRVRRRALRTIPSPAEMTRPAPATSNAEGPEPHRSRRTVETSRPGPFMDERQPC